MFTIYGVYYIEDGDWRYYSTRCNARAEAVDFIREQAQIEHWSKEELADALDEFESMEFVDGVVGIYDLEVY